MFFRGISCHATNEERKEEKQDLGAKKEKGLNPGGEGVDKTQF